MKRIGDKLISVQSSVVIIVASRNQVQTRVMWEFEILRCASCLRQLIVELIEAFIDQRITGCTVDRALLNPLIIQDTVH